MKLYEQIFTLRTAHGMSQGDLADALEVSRQSVSKWETGAAVPELDKLLRMSELFGVSLDELVKGEGAPLHTAAATPQAELAPAEPSPRPEISRTQRILGFCLLGFAALTWLLVTLLGDFLAGVCLALPFVVVGIICLRVHRNAWLFCCWAVFFMAQAFLHFATSTPIISIFTLAHLFIGGFTFGVLSSSLIGLTFCGLLATSLYLYRTQLYPPTKKNVVHLCLCIGAAFLLHALFPLVISPIYAAFFMNSVVSAPWSSVLITTRYLLHYAGQIFLILSVLRAVAMVRYYKTK